MTKRGLSMAAGVVLAVALACGNAAGAGKPPQKLRILASTFPMYLFTRNVTAGVDGVELRVMLSPALGCPHDYVLTPKDMEAVRQSDIFIANGLGLEEFLGEPVIRAHPEIVVVDTSDGIEEVLASRIEGHHDAHAHEGHAAKQKDDHSHEPKIPRRDDSRDHDHDSEQAEANPHLFSSPLLAIKVVSNIAASLASADPVHATAYKKNADAYKARLKALSNQFAGLGKQLKGKRVVTQHGVFDYLFRDMGVEIVAVVQEHPGQEPSAAEMIDLVKRIKQEKASALFTEPQYPARMGEVIAKEAGIPVALLDPVASGPEDAPLDHYEKVMGNNLETLKRVLGDAAN